MLDCELRPFWLAEQSGGGPGCCGGRGLPRFETKTSWPAPLSPGRQDGGVVRVRPQARWLELRGATCDLDPQLQLSLPKMKWPR